MGINIEKYKFGEINKGKRNLITDVPGVRVGHVTLSDGAVQTGVTAIIPGPGSAFREKFPAAMHVINGFGKSAGLIQVDELGTLETPIVLTNTLSVAAGLEGILSYMLPDHPEIGITTGTINPVVMECNDGYLNDIRGRHVKEEHVLKAIADATEDFSEGAVGAGRGMKCYGWKGGIGSASRVLSIGGTEYTVGALLLTNFGKKKDLTVCGVHVGEAGISENGFEKDTEFGKGAENGTDTENKKYIEDENCTASPAADARDQGSCIVLLATDMPLTARQLKRCAHRAQSGLARTGAQISGGSGEIVFMFSTANRFPHSPEVPLCEYRFIHDDSLDEMFRAVAECVEEACISSIYHAETVTGRDGHILYGVRNNESSFT